jgi:hypothetical protein
LQSLANHVSSTAALARVRYNSLAKCACDDGASPNIETAHHFRSFSLAIHYGFAVHIKPSSIFSNKCHTTIGTTAYICNTTNPTTITSIGKYYNYNDNDNDNDNKKPPPQKQ